MILSEIPAPQKERDTHMYSAVHNEPENKPALRVIPTPKDRLMIAVVSLIMLLFLAVMMFGAASILHAGINGWLATLAVIFFAVITINVIMALSRSKLK